MKRIFERTNPCQLFICGMCAYCIDPELEGIQVCGRCKYNDGKCCHCMRYRKHRATCERGIRQEKEVK